MTTTDTYTVYVDDSGTDKQARIIAAACFASPVKKWKGFESAWVAAEEEFGFRHFHMTEFAACRKTDWCRDCQKGKTNEQHHPWRGWSNTKRTKLLRELLRIVCKYGEWGISRAIAKEDIEKYVMHSALKTVAPQWEELTRHFTFVMQACGGDLATWRSERNMANDYIKFVFDLTDQRQKDELACDQVIRPRPAYRGWRKAASCIFDKASSRACGPLVLIATEDSFGACEVPAPSVRNSSRGDSRPRLSKTQLGRFDTAWL
jgi:hypothetical protein